VSLATISKESHSRSWEPESDVASLKLVAAYLEDLIRGASDSEKANLLAAALTSVEQVSKAYSSLTSS
jgi:hypothetical protein